VFEQSGIRTIGQLAALTVDEVEERWGNRGHALWLLAHGKDSRPVISDWERKSISEERTFPADVDDTNKLLRTLEFIADDLARRMRREKLLGRTITLKIRLEGFETYTRSTTLPRAVDDLFSLRDTAGSLFYDFPRRGKKVRLIGIGVSNLVRQDQPAAPGGQLDLFAQSESPRRSEERLLDELRNRFGNHITRARLMRADGEEFHSHM
ncbi:MAG: hypothetical protein KDK30_02965, partial [Leptospiraceae bacterium]|nr:hypothetical protein [Leptospiraceae bacterium]